MKNTIQDIQFVYWFAYFGIDSPSVRYRGKYALESWKKIWGIDYYFVTPIYSINGIICFLIAYCSALFWRKKNAIVVIQRVRSNFIYANLLKILVLLHNKDTVYDIDDSDYLEHNPNSIYFFAKHCHKISAGSRLIVQHLKQYNPNVLHITSPIVDLGIVKEKRNKLFTIGWIGGFNWGHKKSLTTIVFPALLQINFPCQIILCGVKEIEDIKYIENYFGHKKNIVLKILSNIDWNNEKAIQQTITTFDIGIATLENTTIHRSKSGIKIKQYFNNGIPALSSNLPENNAIIQQGENGYFCDSSEDFTKYIQHFYEMTEKEYQQFSVQARKSIINFDHKAYLDSFITLKNLKNDL